MAVVFIEGAVIFIEEAVTFIEGAIIFIGERGSAIERLFKTARVKVGAVKGVNKHDLK